MNGFEDFPTLALDVRPAPPGAWNEIVRRARRRRDRAALAATTVVALVAAVPMYALMHRGDPAAVPAHRPASSYSDLCDTAYDKQAPATDTFDHSIRVGQLLISPAGANKPAVTGEEIRRRAAARRTKLSPGTQVRYGLVRYLSAGTARKTQARWVLTTCGTPRPNLVPGPGNTLKAAGTALIDDVQLLTDSGFGETSTGGKSFAGVCDTRLDGTAPDTTRVQNAFYVGEASVESPGADEQLNGRERVRATLRNRFPGTEIRLGRVRPLHTPGTSRLRWVVTTCGLDGSSVQPQLPGVVNELLVYDAQGRLLEEQRSGPQSEAEAILRTLPPVPFPAPVYKPASPNMCSGWSHAYPDFRQRATAAGYRDMQGCYLQAGAVVIFVSKPGGRAAAAVYRAASGKEYDATYKARFPFARFTFVPAPAGDTVRLIKLLSPHVAEVELSASGGSAVHWKFDAATSAFLPCTDTTATRAPCSR
jgi:hypothetical protein